LQKKTCGLEWNYLAQSVGKSGNLSRQQGTEHRNVRHDDGGVVATKSFETAVRRHLRKSEGPSPSSNLDAKIPSIPTATILTLSMFDAKHFLMVFVF
jgi:hypothetical protein